MLYKLNSNSILASEIAEFLGKEMVGNEIAIYGPGNSEDIMDNTIIFTDKLDLNKISVISSKSEVLVLAREVEKHGEDIEITYILTGNPELDFVKVIKRFFFNEVRPLIYENAVIENGAKIGKNVTIHSGAYIGKDVTIGDNTVVLQNVCISGNVRIGKNCLIKSSSTIGSDIFKFVFDGDKWEQFPQIGKIVIEDNVWIGANTTIEKGSLTDTVIKKEVRIDDLVQIGSGCFINSKSIIAAGSVLCSNVTIGENCWIAPNVSILENIKISSNSKIGLGAVVIKNVGENELVVGNPAKTLTK